MAYVSYGHSKPAQHQHAIHKRNVLRQYNNYISPSTRRLLHLILSFLVGLFAAYVLRTHQFNQMCIPQAAQAVVDSTANGSPQASWKSKQTGDSGSSLLFVGVMTAQKYLETRATAVYHTWGKEVPGKIAFFSSGTSSVPANCAELPLVRLPDVDDSYPPQKKSFMMLQYMWQHYGNDYEWFLRADDDVYIRPDKMEAFLRSINSSKLHFIGQAGRGNQEEFGQLSLEYDENFCMGGPGIILSRETLRRVAPHVEYCLQHLYTTHEDVELGRCVQKFAGISCTWSYEMQSILYHNFSGSLAFTGNLKTGAVHRAITLHPIKHHQQMYRIHNYMQGLKIHDLQQRKISLYRDLRLMEESSKLLSTSSYEHFKDLLGGQRNESTTNLFYKASVVGRPPDLNGYQPRKEDDVFTWDMIRRSRFSDTNFNPRRKIESDLDEGLGDVIRELMDNINLFSRERGRVIEFKAILYGYYRLNPLYGPDYILDVLLTFKKYRGKKMTVPVRRHAYIQQQFADLEIREVDSLTHLSSGRTLLEESDLLGASRMSTSQLQKRINMIMPLFRKHNAFLRFLQTYERVCLQQTVENVALYIILFTSDSTDDEIETQRAVDALATRYPTSINIKIFPLRERFARARALDYGMAQVNSQELMFFIDVDMAWTAETLHRVRSNTVAGRSVYFPIVFSEFNPTISYEGRTTSPNHFLINDESGYFRIFGYGIMSAYKADIQKVGGLNTSIVGWGREDVDLFEKFINFPTNVSIMRSVDPNLVHIFHVVDCDTFLDLSRFTMCSNTRSETYGSVNQLANLVYKYKADILQYASDKLNKQSNKPNS